jgi:DNA-directed RNA polymerase
MDLVTLEAEKAHRRFEKRTDRAIKQAGYGATDGAVWLTEQYLGRATDAVTTKLEAASKLSVPALEAKLRQLPAASIALAALQTIFHSIGMGEPLTRTVHLLGAALAAECWAAALTADNPRLAKRVEAAARRKNSSVRHRRQHARVMAAKEGFSQKRWSPIARMVAGEWLLEAVTKALPDVFQITGGEQTSKHKEPNRLSLMPEAEEAVCDAIEELIQRQPVFLPMLEPPLPWTGWNKGGARNQKAAYAATVVRTHHKAIAAQVRHAIKTRQMQPALDGLNALQAVPWRINKRVLGVLRGCLARGLEVPGLPIPRLPMPAKTKPWEEMDDREKKRWKRQAEQTARKNLALVGERVMLTEDMATADMFASEPRFFTPMNMDWRGRVYAMCSFNFQREDRVRALFEFADGEPIGEEGLWWLKIHTANCGDFDKISKQPLEERVKWVDENLSMIADVATAPLRNLSWLKADKPFLFLAACFELTSAMETGSSYITRLPVSFDGSCSGLQHLCAMTRAPEGALVNLTPAPLPADVYATVAQRVRDRVLTDSERTDWDEGQEWRREVAKLSLDYGIDRKVTKRNVMTYSYSSKKFGMAAQQQTDLMDVLDEEVLVGKRGDHPFGLYAEGRIDRPSAAARYLASHVYEAVEEIISLPAQAMAFLQKTAKACAHQGKPLSWVTPTGLPWLNIYRVRKEEELKLWLHDRGVRTLYRAVVGVGEEEKTIDKEKTANGVAPNFVHALDASHLAFVAAAAAREGITALATVHDSFGCLASRARRFNQIIRAEFVRMYHQHDVLTEVLEAAKRDLTHANWDKVPTVPQFGALNLEEVKHATFAFA